MANTGKYLELADKLAKQIEEELAPGDQFPTVTELARQLGVAPNTASRAVQTLKERGLLSGKAGGKTWVRVQPVTTLRRNTRYQQEKDIALLPESERRKTGVSELDSNRSLASAHRDQTELKVVKAPDDVAEVLGLEPGSLVLRRTGVRWLRKGAGAGKHVSYMPYDLVARNSSILDEASEPWPGGALHQLLTVGVEVGRIEDQVTASMPTDEEMEEQDIPPRVPVLRVRKITYAITGEAVEVADIPLPADRAKLVYVTPLEPWS
ncbi:GntR family transcriptional regulator [Streptomyces sp. NPDC055025]